jgi:hypothetical protein
MSEKASEFEERLSSHPILKDGMASLPELIEDRDGSCDTADDAEQKVIDY